MTSVQGSAPRTRSAERAAHPRLRPVALGLVAAAVLAQVAYPLLDGGALRGATFAAVLLAASAVTADAVARRGAAWAAAAVGTTVVVSALAEAVGVRTGVPFGEYAYAGTLGPEAAGVPLLVPLAWVMIAYPCWAVARRLVGPGRLGPRRAAVAVPLVGAVAMTGWDVFLDPQMVAAGHWAWEHPEPALPGVPGIPLTNYAGWLVVSTALLALLDRLPDPPGDPGAPLADDAVPLGLFAWAYVGNVVGAAVFFGRPAAAATGAVALGLVAVPLALVLARRRPR